jgi:hypothetical protein
MIHEIREAKLAQELYKKNLDIQLESQIKNQDIKKLITNFSEFGDDSSEYSLNDEGNNSITIM